MKVRGIVRAEIITRIISTHGKAKALKKETRWQHLTVRKQVVTITIMSFCVKGAGRHFGLLGVAVLFNKDGVLRGKADEHPTRPLSLPTTKGREG